MHAKLKYLSTGGLRRYLRILAWLHLCEYISLVPFPLRLGLLHVSIMFVYLLFSPLPGSVTPAFIPLVWMASLATALGLWSMGRLVMNRLVMEL